MAAPAEPTEDALIAFAESLLQKLPPRLRERDILEQAVRDHRETWLTLFAADASLKAIEDSG